MITNLFSIFDPRTSLFSTSWTILVLAISIITIKSWYILQPTKSLEKKVVITFYKETGFTIGKREKGTQLIIMLIFSTILLINFIALYPQIFSITSHLTINLPLSILIWSSIVVFGWIKNTKHILSHLLPQGTPVALIRFMVLIELTRSIIRPITLCVRLTANLIAGHLLISLLGNALLALPSLYSTFALVAPLILTVLERAVSCIQAYVFITLVTLYTTEIK